MDSSSLLDISTLPRRKAGFLFAIIHLMTAEKKIGSDKAGVDKSKIIFNNLKDRLVSNPDLDFIDGFLNIFPGGEAYESNRLKIEELVMFVAPKPPILNLKKIDAFAKQLGHKLDTISESRNFDYVLSKSIVKKKFVQTGELHKSEVLWNEKRNNQLVFFTREARILFFPDKTSAMEAVGEYRFRGERSHYSVLNSEQVTRLYRRNNYGLVNKIKEFFRDKTPQS
ncbi:MAG: hypothetical protein HW400_473 [Candidatus Levybacteria bacterium]|nr:hypothetical protein [Candidatus Levybacteria bacterium]